MSEFDKEYVIEESDIRAHAPFVFKCIRRHYYRVQKLSESFPDPKYINNYIADAVKTFGVLPEGEVRYEDTLLDFEPFRLTVIFHLCISIWLEGEIEWEQYISFLDLLEKTVSYSDENRPDSISIQSTLLRMFSVSPKVLPKGFVQASQSIDELTQASSLISDEVQKVRLASDGFVNYHEYFEYMKGIAANITKILHEKEMYSTHGNDRFAVILISMKNGIPLFDLPYDCQKVERAIMETNGIIRIQQKLLSIMAGLDPGEDWNDDSNEDLND